MYPNLRAEMGRRNVDLSTLAEALGITLQTVSRKFNGKNDWTYHEAVKVKRYLDVDMPIEELFEEKEEEEVM